VISVFGIIIYSVILPIGVFLVLRSRWSRDVFTHDNLAHTHLVGFLTSVYRKEYHLWQLASCLLKLILISIPMFMSKNPIVQSLAVFITMLMYTFFILHLRPMQSSYLNKLEILSCIGVLVGAFTSVFFVVEYDGSLLLSGSAKDFVGLLFVAICAACFLLSARLMFQDFSRLLLMHKIMFLKSWILVISTRLGAAGTEGTYVPLVATAFNKVASAEIFQLKRKMRLELIEFKQSFLKRHGLLVSFWANLRTWFHEQRLSHTARQYKPSPEKIEKCMKTPELEALVYLHKLSERIVAWERVSWKYWDTKPTDLPKEFIEVKGDADPPHAEYAYQTNVIHMLEDALPASVHRVLTALMFSYLMSMARSDLTPAERQCVHLLHVKTYLYTFFLMCYDSIWF
jgi:hypothetical protein